MFEKTVRPDKEIKILGTNYRIFFDVPEDEMAENCDGQFDYSTKTIKVIKMKTDRNSVENIDAYKRKVLRHEIIHAFMFESGMWNNSGESEAWGLDETIVDWFAIQSPKIYKAFEEAGCLCT